MMKLNRMNSKAIISACAAAAAFLAFLTVDAHARWTLAENGTSRAVVVSGENATAVERHAAEELSYFLSRVTGADIRVSPEPVPGKYPVWLGTPETSPPLARRFLADRVERLTAQGFILRADASGLLIAGREPLGVLYGAYAFLEDHVGIRWYYPGEEGQYIPGIPVLRVGRISEKQEPSFGMRTVAFSRVGGHQYTPDTWDWATRNRMQLRFHPRQAEEYVKRGALVRGGGHVLSTIIPDELFDEHPEYFGLYDGERRKQHGHRGQPCTTHPEVIRITAEYIIDWFEQNPGGIFTLNNNDYPRFCECENCVALDPPGEREKNMVATRFFTFKEEVARRVFEAVPDARINTLAYQTFRQPPTAVAPDSRLRVTLCDHGRCFRHALDDEDCEANRWFRMMFTGWAEFDNPRGYFPYYNMIGGQPREGIIAVPMENIVAADMRYMHGLGHDAWSLRVRPPDASYAEQFDTPATREEWRAHYPWFYMQAKLAWDIDRDVDAMMVEMNEKLYGPAADAMGRYRDEIRRLWEETPGHFIYGAPFEVLGRTLAAAPEAENELRGILAEAAASAAGAPEYERRVAEEKRIFEDSWVFAAERYMELPIEDIEIPRREGEITIDGRLDEEDWLMHEPVTGFIRRGHERAPAEFQTYVRLLYDDEYLYVGARMDEPMTEHLVVKAEERDSRLIWGDDTLELFIDPDGLALRYVHIVVNAGGAFRDSERLVGEPPAGDVSFQSGAVVAVETDEDGWTVEIKVPAESLGGVIHDGGSWRMDVGRVRAAKAGYEGEVSSWMDGTFHNPETFRNIIFEGR